MEKEIKYLKEEINFLKEEVRRLNETKENKINKDEFFNALKENLRKMSF